MALFHDTECLMPLYNYQCAKCGKIFEMLEKAAGEKNRTCPYCGGKANKQFSVPAKPVVADSGARGCCGETGGCENPRRCCGR